MEEEMKVILLGMDTRVRALALRLERLEGAIENLEAYIKGEVADGVRELLKKSCELSNG